MCLDRLAISVDQPEINISERWDGSHAAAFLPPPFRIREKKGMSAPNAIGVFTKTPRPSLRD
jgi:hypothetical protein